MNLYFFILSNSSYEIKFNYLTPNLFDAISQSSTKFFKASLNAWAGVISPFVCIFNSTLFSRGWGFLYPANLTFGFLRSIILAILPKVWSSNKIVNTPVSENFSSFSYSTLLKVWKEDNLKDSYFFFPSGILKSSKASGAFIF